MNTALRACVSLIVGGALIGGCDRPPKAADNMSFFVTSVSAGHGGDLGGLAGADAHCQALAQTVGAGNRTWRAYLSAAAEDGRPAVHARDRIGRGPWFNAKGVQVAASLADLHRTDNGLGNATSLDERGQPVGYFHDMLTGSTPDGTLASENLTCRNWTSTQGRAMVGHSDKGGSCCGDRANSWNSAHESAGCTLPALQAMGGNARYYCFAAE